MLFKQKYLKRVAQPKKVWNRVNKLNGFIIKGNHEDLLYDSFNSPILCKEIKMKYGTGHQVALNQLSIEDIKQLYNLPEKKLIQIKEYSFELNHGSPWDQNAYLYPDTALEILEKANNPAIDFVLVGHSHYPFIKKLSHSTIINPGSVGQNRQVGGFATWVLMDLEEMGIEIISTKYSVKSLAKKVKALDPDKSYNYSILFRK